MAGELVVLTREQVEDLILQAHLRALKLTGKLFDDAEMAAFCGYTVESWQALVRQSPSLSSKAATFARPGARRPRRRWPAWEIVPLLQQGGEGVPQPPKRRREGARGKPTPA